MVERCIRNVLHQLRQNPQSQYYQQHSWQPIPLPSQQITCQCNKNLPETPSVYYGFILWVAPDSLCIKWGNHNFWTKTLGLMVGLHIWTWRDPRRSCVSQVSDILLHRQPLAMGAIFVPSERHNPQGIFNLSNMQNRPPGKLLKNYKCPCPTPDYTLEP